MKNNLTLFPYSSALKFIFHTVIACFLAFNILTVDEATAQNTTDAIVVTGQVTSSASGEGLPGVNILIKGTNKGTTTDINGEYRIKVEGHENVLVFSFVGFITQEIMVGNRDVINVSLKSDVSQLKEMVVIGYGTAQREDVTGSIASIDVGEATETRTVTSIGQLLQGRVTGLQAGISTYADGSTTLRVRGQNSILAANNPLIVVDGVPFQGSLSDLNPNDIASIDVLKGAAAAAVYGASAAAGVIAVSTKHGQTAKPTIRFKSSIGISATGNLVHPFGPKEYINYRRDNAERSDPGASEFYYTNPKKLPSNFTLEEWKALGAGGGKPMEIWLGRIGLRATEIQNYLSGQTINWYDEVYRDAALRQNYNISISGKPEYVSYYLSLGYVDNKSQVVGGRYKALHVRMNLGATVTDWLKVSLNSWYTNRNEGFLEANVEHAQRVSPLGDMYAKDGTLKWYPHGDGTAINPFVYTTQSGRSFARRNQNLRASLRANVDLPFGLRYKVRWTNNYSFRHDYLFNPSTVPWGRPAGKAHRYEYTEHLWRVGNILTWNRTITDIHSFDATLLFSVEVEEDKTTQGNSEDFPLESLGYHNLSIGGTQTISSYDDRTTGTALMARLNYQLLDRYLFTVSYRRDGYSAFGQNHPYAYFPSAAFAWRISEESFFNIDLINNLKLRLAWGVNGNRSIGPYSALQRMTTGYYIYGTETIVGISPSNLPNENLKWERTTQYNIGLDFGLFHNRLSGNVDVYYMSTTDLLLRRTLPDITGFNSIYSNLGEVVNRGLELSITSVNVQQKNFTWQSTVNFWFNRNEIKHLYGTQVSILNEAGEIVGYREADDRENGWFIGHALHQIYDYKIVGVWQADEAKKAARYGSEPGDFHLLDVNNDGNLTPLEDKVFQGYTKPRYRLSLLNNFSYKNFTVSALIMSQIGGYTTHNVHQHAGYTYGRHNQLDYPYWTPGNPIDEWARLSSEVNPSFNYWEETTFVRLQSVSLSYHFPVNTLNSLDVKNATIFFNAENVLTITGFDGNDPEAHQHVPQVFKLGFNLTF